MCLGMMGMSQADYLECSLRTIFNKIRGFQQIREQDFKNEWERARMMALWIMSPHVKSVPDPQKFVLFPWEQEIKKKMTGEEIAQMIRKGIEEQQKS